MNHPITLPQNAVTIVDGQPVTTSLVVAKLFEKRHKNVIQSLKSLDCSGEFRGLNFQPTSFFIDQPRGGKRQSKGYNITEKGFMFLAMGFTGKKAAQFKEALIDKFEEMKTKLQEKAEITTVNNSDNNMVIAVTEAMKVMTTTMATAMAGISQQITELRTEKTLEVIPHQPELLPLGSKDLKDRPRYTSTRKLGAEFEFSNIQLLRILVDEDFIYKDERQKYRFSDPDHMPFYGREKGGTIQFTPRGCEKVKQILQKRLEEVTGGE